MPDLETSLSYCTYCPKLCRHTCPVSTAEPREPLVPQAKMAQMRLLRTSQVERSAQESESLYGCTGCGACTDFCRHHIAVAPSLFVGRAEAVAERRGHRALEGFADRFQAHHRRIARRQRARIPAERRKAEAQVALLPGCDRSTRPERALALFDRLGANYVALVDSELGCGGYPLYAAGELDALRLHAERMSRALRGYARVLVGCPACVMLMRTEYPRLGVPIAAAIDHPVEFLEGFAERLPVKRRRAAAFYHDPCYLGRHLGIYDAPRRLVGKVVDDVREFSRARAESECSGGGGLVPLTMPGTARAIADRRLVEVAEAGVPTVVTACATCRRQLGGRRDPGAGGASRIEAIDVIDLLAEATD